MSPTCNSICSWRRAGVAGKVAIWSSAWVSCAIASTSAERASERCPALAHRGGSLLDQPRFRAVTRDKFWLALDDFRELLFQNFGNTGV